jgi:hypothetical protein
MPDDQAGGIRDRLTRNAPSAALYRVCRTVACEQAVATPVSHEDVEPTASDEDVVAAPPLQQVGSVAPDESVVSGFAVEGVEAAATPDCIVASTPAEEILLPVPDQDVVSRASGDTFDVRIDGVRLARLAVVRTSVEVDADRTRPAGIVDDVRAACTAERVGTAPAVEKVELCPSCQGVVAATAREDVLAGAALNLVVA